MISPDLRKLLVRFFAGVLVVPFAISAPDMPPGFPSISFSINGAPYQTVDKVLDIPAGSGRITVKMGDDSASRTALHATALRFAYQWVGVDQDLNLRNGEMGLAVRYYNDKGGFVGLQEFLAIKESPGWKGTFEHSRMLHRREFVTIPEGVEKMGMLLTSAGPPDSIGVYVADNIRVERNGPDGKVARIFSFDLSTEKQTDPQNPDLWIRDGTKASMAQVVNIDGPSRHSPALCIVDDDPVAHAEWRLRAESYIPVHPGETLLIEWDEMYSIGLAHVTFPAYSCPPPGIYKFRVWASDPMGMPIAEKSITINVFRPFWMKWWFWAIVACAMAVPVTLGIRAIIRARVRWHLLRIEQERMVEQERLRIARNIHDDLGARLTHISLVSSSAENEELSSDEFRSNLRKISVMTRDLVASLYETVWSVNPQNDHVNALINHLAQMTENMCQSTGIVCRMNVPSSLTMRPLASGVRHAISLTVKEALHNAIKHSRASEITAKFSERPSSLLVEIADNGCGFESDKVQTGYGLENMKHRVREIGGRMELTSTVGSGTKMTLEIPLP